MRENRDTDMAAKIGITRLILLFFKYMAIAIAGLTGLVLIFRFYENRRPPCAPLSSEQRKVLENYLASEGKAPADFVMEAFRSHPVVILGEPHRIADHYDFLKSILERLSKEGVDNLAIEFFLISQQQDMDRLISSENFDEKLARRIILSPRICFYFQELMDILHQAWKVNRSGRLRVLCLGQYDQKPAQRKVSTDLRMASIISAQADAGKKTLVYCGNHHAFTRYAQPPLLPWFKKSRTRMGNYLTDGLPGLKKHDWTPFFISFHMPLSKKYFFFIPILLYDKPFTMAFDGVFDQLFQGRTEPIAFESRGLPEWVADTFSYYSISYDRVPASLYADGYIYLKPMSQCRFITPLKDIGGDPEEKALLKKVLSERLFQLMETPERAERVLRHDGIKPQEWAEGTDLAGLDLKL